MWDLSGIQGWFTSGEQELLYRSVAASSGAILEVGSWAGKSTLCIANALVDFALASRFVTIDLFPSLENFKPVDGETIGYFVDGRGPFGTMPIDFFRAQMEPVLRYGIRKMLNENLARHGVKDRVEVIQADLNRHPFGNEKFGFIFADCIHDVNELDHNLPSILGLGEEECVYAFHDIDGALFEELKNRIPLTPLAKADSLLVFSRS